MDGVKYEAMDEGGFVFQRGVLVNGGESRNSMLVENVGVGGVYPVHYRISFEDSTTACDHRNATIAS